MTSVGLIAGNGIFPRLFADAAHARGRRVVAVGMRGETCPTLVGHVDRFTWTRVGQIKKLVRFFLSENVEKIALVGGVNRVGLFGRARPDWDALKILGRFAVRADDSLLRALAGYLEDHGLQILDSTHFLPEIMAPEGTLTSRAPNAKETQDIAYGVALAREIGRLGVGQTVVIREGTVLALEAIEGTDACIRRAGTLGGRGGIVVKVAKPGQDMRFDVPAVGIQTLQAMQQAGLSLLVLEAGRTLILDVATFLHEAEGRNITVVGHRAAP